MSLSHPGSREAVQKAPMSMEATGAGRISNALRQMRALLVPVLLGSCTVNYGTMGSNNRTYDQHREIASSGNSGGYGGGGQSQSTNINLSQVNNNSAPSQAAAYPLTYAYPLNYSSYPSNYYRGSTTVVEAPSYRRGYIAPRYSNSHYYPDMGRYNHGRGSSYHYNNSYWWESSETTTTTFPAQNGALPGELGTYNR